MKDEHRRALQRRVRVVTAQEVVDPAVRVVVVPPGEDLAVESDALRIELCQGSTPMVGVPVSTYLGWVHRQEMVFLSWQATPG